MFYSKTKVFQMTLVEEKVTYGFILMPSKLTVSPGQGVRTAATKWSTMLKV